MHSIPLLNEISEYLKQAHVGFHTPGHQQGKGCAEKFKKLLEKFVLQMDLTELPGLDNLKNPSGCLRESQRLAADLFAALETFYLINGSTVGLQAAILALNSPGGKVIIPRHVHVSVINGLVLSGGEPLIAPVTVEKTWGFPLGVHLDKLVALLSQEESVDFLLTVQPTYQGVGLEAAKINKIIQEKGIPHIVDEAHGAHLFFQEKHPLSLQKEKADLVIQSTHKTLSAFTQASMLHVNNKKLLAPVREALNILQTTSPSYLLMASLDSVQFQMAAEGRLLVEKVLELADLFREQIIKIPGYAVFSAGTLPLGWYHDSSKVLVSAAELGLTGWELADILKEKYGIVVEMSDYYYVLFLVTLGHNQEDIKKAVTALRDIWQYERRRPLLMLEYPVSIYEQSVQIVLTPREVYYHKKEEQDITHVAGRICGNSLTVYPPGIPCLWAGQLIRQEQVEYLKWALAHNLNIQGLGEGGRVTVVK